MISPANLLRDLPDASGGEITQVLLTVRECALSASSRWVS